MEKFTKGWVQHLRNTSRQPTPSHNVHRSSRNAESHPKEQPFETVKTRVRRDGLRRSTAQEAPDSEVDFQDIVRQGNDAIRAVISKTNESLDTKNRATTRERLLPGHAEVGCTAEDVTAEEDASEEDTEGEDASDDNKSDDQLDRQQQPSDGIESFCRGSRGLCSPPGSIARQHGSPPTVPRPSKPQESDCNDDFHRGLEQKNAPVRQLWVPDDNGKDSVASRPAKTPQAWRTHHRPERQRPQRRQQNRAHSQLPIDDVHASKWPAPPSLPKVVTVSAQQLVAEARGIYSGLMLLESKCIECDTRESQTDLGEEQYHALITLHQALLHEHFDFFLATQHPIASDSLKSLATKYAMPARMWRHGIHSFLELLRAKLPESHEHLLAFIHVAFSIMSLLVETVPAFRATWIECLGDLGRYRMAIEDSDARNRELWNNVAKYWYTQASDNAPTTGRLYHHLAILARPNVLEQLFFYSKSLCVKDPFSSAWDSILTFFDSLLDTGSLFYQRRDPVHAAFVRVHGILFSDKGTDQLQSAMDHFHGSLEHHIVAEQDNWLEPGYHMAISLSCLLLGYGSKSNVLMQAMSHSSGDGDVENGTSQDHADADAIIVRPNPAFDTAVSFAGKTCDVVMGCGGAKNTLACLHTTLVFYLFMHQRPSAMSLLEKHFPWKLLSRTLNRLRRMCDFPPRIDTTDFPGPEKSEPPHPLPEDYAMRGLIYTEGYFPPDWFNNDKIEVEARYLEPPSIVGKRLERILWIGRMIARQNKWLVWDEETEEFTVTAEYDCEP
ncbi:hypothetical protein E4U51_005605 [Claviceps purpurea]|nr:hypothetical protein E4U51_005605 [Claviceps purpurea]